MTTPFQDNFETETLGNTPSLWTTVEPGTSTVRVQNHPTAAQGKAAKIIDAADADSPYIEAGFTGLDEGFLAFNIRAQETNAHHQIAVKDLTAGVEFTLKLEDDGHIKYTVLDDDGTVLSVSNLPTDTTYAADTDIAITILWDFSASNTGFDVWVNGVQKASGLNDNVTSYHTTVDAIRFEGHGATTSTFWVDDVVVSDEHVVRLSRIAAEAALHDPTAYARLSRTAAEFALHDADIHARLSKAAVEFALRKPDASVVTQAYNEILLKNYADRTRVTQAYNEVVIRNPAAKGRATASAVAVPPIILSGPPEGPDGEVTICGCRFYGLFEANGRMYVYQIVESGGNYAAVGPAVLDLPIAGRWFTLVNNYAFSLDGKYLAISTSTGASGSQPDPFFPLVIYRTDDWTEFIGPIIDKKSYEVAWSHDSTRLLVNHKDTVDDINRTHIYSVPDWALLHTFSGVIGEPTWSYDDTMIAGTSGLEVKVHSGVDYSLLQTLDPGATSFSLYWHGPKSPTWHPDGTHLAVVHSLEGLTIWDTSDWSEMAGASSLLAGTGYAGWGINGPAYPVYVKFSPAGDRFGISQYRGTFAGAFNRIYTFPGFSLLENHHRDVGEAVDGYIAWTYDGGVLTEQWGSLNGPYFQDAPANTTFASAYGRFDAKQVVYGPGMPQESWGQVLM